MARALLLRDLPDLFAPLGLFFILAAEPVVLILRQFLQQLGFSDLFDRLRRHFGHDGRKPHQIIECGPQHVFVAGGASEKSDRELGIASGGPKKHAA